MKNEGVGPPKNFSTNLLLRKIAFTHIPKINKLILLPQLTWKKILGNTSLKGMQAVTNKRWKRAGASTFGSNKHSSKKALLKKYVCTPEVSIL
jgi:hypothetical protein